MAKGNFSACHALTAKWEGGWSDHDADPGGATMFGITIDTLSRWRGRKVKKEEVKALTRAEAEKIYKAWYWDKIRADELPAGIDLVVYDYAVNSGPGRAVKHLQKVVGVAQDGIVGPMTLSAAKGATPELVINNLCDERLAFLKRLSHWSTFSKGWTRRVSDVRTHALAMVMGDRLAPKPAPQPPAPSPTPKGSQGGLIGLLIAAAIGAAVFIISLIGD